MKLQAYRIKERKEFYVEIVEPVSLEDVDVEIVKPRYDGDKYVDASIYLHLKKDAQMQVRILASKDDRDRIIQLEDNYGKDSNLIRDHYMGIIMGRYHGGLFRGWSDKLDFRGIRKQETRDAKIQSAIMERAGKMFMEQDEVIAKLLERFNGQLETVVNNHNADYLTFMKGLYSGQHISEDWKKEHLDDAKVNAELDILDAQMEELQEQRKAIIQRKVEARNRNMYLYLEGNDWGNDEDSWDHDPLPEHLREEFVELYKSNKCFGIASNPLNLGVAIP